MTLYGFYPKRYKYPFGFLGAKQKKPKQSFRQCRPSGSDLVVDLTRTRQVFHNSFEEISVFYLPLFLSLM